MINTPTLQTKRLILRQFTKNDLEALLTIFGDVEVNTYLPWFPLKSMEEAEVFYQKNYADIYKEKQGYRYAVCLKEDNVPIGYVNVSMDDSHDLGYGIRKEFWHQGIATEAAQGVLTQLKADGFLYVTATHDRKNIRSGHVMKALGMKYQYSYEELWQPKDFLVVFRMYQLNFDGNDERVYKAYWEKYAKHFIEE